jgi:DNA-binding ferritin-like protein
MNELKEKLNKAINNHAERIAQKGSSSFSTCDHYGWDEDTWRHRHSIIDKLREMGFNVSQETNHGVLDVTVTANLDL